MSIITAIRSLSSDPFHRGETVVGVEVKAASFKRPTVSRAARSFLQAYGPRILLLVTMGYTAVERIGDTEVRWIEPTQLAGDMRQAFKF